MKRVLIILMVYGSMVGLLTLFYCVPSSYWWAFVIGGAVYSITTLTPAIDYWRDRWEN